MIAQLSGLVAALEADRCVIDVHGVGYLVQAAHPDAGGAAAAAGGGAGAGGDAGARGRDSAVRVCRSGGAGWFRLLTTVQGVGAKVALGILSALSPRELVAAIAAGDRGR